MKNLEINPAKKTQTAIFTMLLSFPLKSSAARGYVYFEILFTLGFLISRFCEKGSRNSSKPGCPAERSETDNTVKQLNLRHIVKFRFDGILNANKIITGKNPEYLVANQLVTWGGQKKEGGEKIGT